METFLSHITCPSAGYPVLKLGTRRAVWEFVELFPRGLWVLETPGHQEWCLFNAVHRGPSLYLETMLLAWSSCSALMLKCEKRHCS